MFPEAFKPELNVSVPNPLEGNHWPAAVRNPGMLKPKVPGGVADVP